MSAVAAARTVADRGVRRVALSQAWAYGLTLFLAPGSQVLDLPVRPSPDELRTTAVDCDVVALYDDVVRDRPELLEVLRQAGFSRVARFAVGNSRAVVVFVQAPCLLGREAMGAGAGWGHEPMSTQWERCQAPKRSQAPTVL